MRKFLLEVSEKNFNLLWQSLHAQELALLKIIDEHEDDPEGELAAFAGNDLIYLRLFKKDLEKMAKEACFGSSAFILSGKVIPT